MKLYTACFQSGEFIEEVETVEEGIEKIKAYEKKDKEDGIYEEGFYSVENEEHETIYYEFSKFKIDKR